MGNYDDKSDKKSELGRGTKPDYARLEKTWVLEKTYAPHKEWTKGIIVQDIKLFISRVLSELDEERSIRSFFLDVDLISSEYAAFLESLFEKDDEAIFEVGLPLFKYIVLASELSSFTAGGLIFPDFGFYNKDGRASSSNSHLFLKDHLVRHIKVLSANDALKFKSLAKKWLDFNSASFIQLVLEGYKALPEMYTDEFLELFKLLDKEQLLFLLERISENVRDALKLIFPFFGDAQKDWFSNWLLQLKDPKESKLVDYGDKKGRHYNYGTTQLLFFQCLPEEYIYSHSKLKKQFQELKRRFPYEINDIAPRKMPFSWQRVPYPIEPDAFSKMPYTSLVKLLRSYGNSKEEAQKRRDESSMGDVVFQAVVNDAPFFIPILEKIIEEDVPLHFKIRGLQAILESKVPTDFNKVLKIFKQVLKKIDWKGRDSMTLIRRIDYFIQRRFIDEELFRFIEFCALEHPDPNSDTDKYSDSLNHSLNCVRGVACEMLTFLNYNNEFEKKVFEVLNKAVNDKVIAVRLAIARKLGHLIKLNRVKTLELFLKNIEDGNVIVYQQTTWTAKYLVSEDFEKLENYFKTGMAIDHIQKEVGFILMICWLRSYKGSKELLDQAVAFSDNAKGGVLSVAFENLNEENTKVVKKCKEMIELMSSSNVPPVNLVVQQVLRDKSNLPFPLLKPYVVNILNNTGKQQNLRLIFKVIENQIINSPKECIEILQQFEGFQAFDRQYFNFRSDPLKMALNAYRIFWDNGDEEWMEKTMDLFDLFLQDKGMRMGYEKDRKSA